MIALWIVAAVAVIATSPSLPATTNESSFLPGSYESIRASNLQARHVPDIDSITAGQPSPNHLVQAAAVAMLESVVNGTGTAAGDAIKVLRADIKPLAAGTGLTEGITGSAAHLDRDRLPGGDGLIATSTRPPTWVPTAR